ncbi:MAG: hypothetical protein F4X98_15050 [Gammaproteobacteria bacterium]|nr:hypothetical protein [Gammaproteobacteria bacterium]
MSEAEVLAVCVAAERFSGFMAGSITSWNRPYVFPEPARTTAASRSGKVAPHGSSCSNFEVRVVILATTS